MTRRNVLAGRAARIGLGAALFRVILLLGLGAALAACRKAEPVPPPVPVAFIALAGPDQAEHRWARQQLQDEFGPRVRITAVEVADGPQAQRQLDELVADGARLIIATSPGLDEVMLRGAAGADSVRFEQRAGYRRLGNLRGFDLRGYEASYLAGVQAGMTSVTRSVEVRLAAGLPMTPERLCEINAFALGARSVDERIRVRVVVEGGPALADGGAKGAARVAEPDHRLTLAPEGIALFRSSGAVDAGAAAWVEAGRASLSWLPYYRRAMQDLLDGSWTSASAWWGVRDGVVGWAESGPVDAAAQERLQAVRAALRDGRQTIWRGPLRDQTGQILLREGEVADDRFLHGLHVLIQGVDGTLAPMR